MNDLSWFAFYAIFLICVAILLLLCSVRAVTQQYMLPTMMTSPVLVSETKAMRHVMNYTLLLCTGKRDNVIY